jgi:hypothetical protein
LDVAQERERERERKKERERDRERKRERERERKRERQRETERDRERERKREREREREWNFKVIAFFQTDGQQQTRQSRKNVVNKLLLWVDVAGGSGKNIGAIRECQVVDFVRRRATDKFGSRRSVGLPKIHSF